ncbi:response regulator [Kiloniella antarctica]|jgi:two-component system cell cycle response regulator CpdR|uniref:Response regulator n=1 Tax=Kiloniella antarctica TaxID=1550907 RepID=A0ABW5BDN9_9PROT
MADILLAEDDDNLRYYLQRALERAGHKVVAAANGLEAEETLSFHRFDLVLTDVVMPEKGGIDLAKAARQFHPDIRVMFITGFSGVVLSEAEGMFGEATLLSKPFHLKELVIQVEKVLASSRR